MIRLEELVAAARQTAARDKRSESARALEARLEDRGWVGREPGRFRRALEGDPISVIAEVKGASPVGGTLRVDLQPAELAVEYARHGAAAISVLTEETRFGGSLEHLRAVGEAVSVPTLRKDFVTDPYQVLQAADRGAAAVLLIAEVLDPGRLRELVRLAHEFGVDALVEVHDRASIDSALQSGSGLIGVNNRNLETMRVESDHALSVAAELPEGWVTVAESGIADRAAVLAAERVGYDAVLVGTSLVTSPDPGAVLRALLGRED